MLHKSKHSAHQDNRKLQDTVSPPSQALKKLTPFRLRSSLPITPRRNNHRRRRRQRPRREHARRPPDPATHPPVRTPPRSPVPGAVSKLFHLDDRRPGAWLLAFVIDARRRGPVVDGDAAGLAPLEEDDA